MKFHKGALKSKTIAVFDSLTLIASLKKKKKINRKYTFLVLPFFALPCPTLSLHSHIAFLITRTCFPPS